jgi:hypothetical protein
LNSAISLASLLIDPPSLSAQMAISYRRVHSSIPLTAVQDEADPQRRLLKTGGLLDRLGRFQVEVSGSGVCEPVQVMPAPA